MAHIHIVRDSDARFIIDPMTRAIKKEESPKVSLIVGDHNSERFSFELPRYIEGHDMSLCNVVRVHYMNSANTSKGEQSVGVYEVDDFGIISTDDTKMGFSWLISNKATKYVGKLAFTVQFACMTGHRVDYSWQTGVYSAMSISDGINGSEIVFDEYADILQQWWLKIYASSELPIEFYTVDEFAALNGETEPQVLYLLEDDPTVDMIYNHETRIADHETRISDNTEQITDHETRISDNTNQITDHETRISDNTNQITDHETRISNNTNKLTDHETRISNNTNKLTDHETRISNNTEQTTSLQSYNDALLKYQSYTVLKDTRSNIDKPFVSGLWLFNVSVNGNNPVSVIMDTAKEYSSVFYLKVTSPDTGTVSFWPVALQRIETENPGMVKIRIVTYTYDSGLSYYLEQYGMFDEYIEGRPFGFRNPLG